MSRHPSLDSEAHDSSRGEMVSGVREKLGFLSQWIFVEESFLGSVYITIVLELILASAFLSLIMSCLCQKISRLRLVQVETIMIVPKNEFDSSQCVSGAIMGM